MRRILISLILAGALGCRADNGSKASSQMGENASAAPPQTMSAPSPEPPAAAIPFKPQRETLPLLVCFGDSLTAGYGADEGASYPDFLQKDLNRKGFHYRVINEGISGNTTKDGLDRVNGIVAMHPEVVVLEFGGNDGLRGLKVQTTRNNLAQMVGTLKRAGIKVVLAGISLPPDYGPDYVKSFTATYTTLGKQSSIPVLPFLLKDVYGVPGMMQADNTHATDAGNEIVARNVLPFVEPLLRR